MRRRPDELEKMRRAGRVVAEMHERIGVSVRPGVTTAALDAIAREVLERRGARSNFLGYGSPPYPAVICTSPNEVVVHGIPGERRLEEGDLLAVDCGAIVDGYHGDAAFTMGVGELAPADAELCSLTEAAMWAGIAAARDGARLHEIGAAVEGVVRSGGMSVVREWVGHGIGTSMHEPPDVPNYWPGSGGPRLRAGMPLCIEPMVAAGSGKTRVHADGWTVATADGSRSAHFEHTVVVTEGEAEVLTGA